MNKLTVYTNMPTPYQLDFFDALSDFFSLKVIYFSVRENDRQWDLPYTSSKYEVELLKDNWISKLIQRKIPSFHFSNAIVGTALRDKNNLVIINGTYWTPNVLISLLISRLRGKYVWFYGEALFPVKNRLRFLFKKVLIFPIRLFANGIIAVGTTAVDSYKLYGYRGEIVNIPYNIDISLFDEEYINPVLFSELRMKYAPNSEILFLTSGALIKRKGIDIVVKAFKNINNGGAALLILGDGEERGYLEDLAKGHSNIYFIGFVEKRMVPYYFKISDVFVFGSWYDGWGLVINEAIAADLAIICSNRVGAAIDKLTDGKNAIICDPENIREYSDAMSLLINNVSKRTELKRKSGELKGELSSFHSAKKLYAVLSVDE